MKKIEDLSIKIFADGANKSGMIDMCSKPYIKGFTTNPSHLRKAGVSDIKVFAKEMLSLIKDRPICFEVISDDFLEMKEQALTIADWGDNVYVKIPVTNTSGIPSYDLINELAETGIHLTITAICTLKQVIEVSSALGNHQSFVAVFAGRVADTGTDPLPVMSAAVQVLSIYPKQELLWSSTREVLNIFQADSIGCHIITATNDILKKLELVGKDHSEYSLDTVKEFRSDAISANLQI